MNAFTPLQLGDQIPGFVGAIATGSTQADAVPITSKLTIFTSVDSGTGCVLPSTGASHIAVQIINNGANSLSVYPAGAGQIDALGASQPYSIPASGAAEFHCQDPVIGAGTQWYSSATGGNVSSLNVTGNASIGGSATAGSLTTTGNASIGGALTLSAGGTSNGALSIPVGGNNAFSGGNTVTGLNPTWDQGLIHFQRLISSVTSPGNHSHGMSFCISVTDPAPANGSETAAVVGFAKTASPSSSFATDVVGVAGEGVIASGNTSGHIWGGLFEAAMADNTADGALRAGEFGVNNLGSVVTSIDGPNGKYGVWINSPGNRATAAIATSSGPAGSWYYGAYIRNVAGEFIHLGSPSSSAKGIVFENSANWAAAITLPNNSTVAALNATGTAIDLLKLNSSNAFHILTATTFDAGATITGTVSAGSASFTAGGDATNGNISLGLSSGSATTPYFDWHFGISGSESYNVRIINDASHVLSFYTQASPSTNAFRISATKISTANDATIGGTLTVSTGATTWTSGTGAPSSTQPAGSLYSRTDGASGSRLYVSAGGGTWNAVAGV